MMIQSEMMEMRCRGYGFCVFFLDTPFLFLPFDLVLRPFFTSLSLSRVLFIFSAFFFFLWPGITPWPYIYTYLPSSASVTSHKWYETA